MNTSVYVSTYKIYRGLSDERINVVTNIWGCNVEFREGKLVNLNRVVVKEKKVQRHMFSKHLKKKKNIVLPTLMQCELIS